MGQMSKGGSKLPPQPWAKGPHAKEIRRLNAQLGGELEMQCGVCLAVNRMQAAANRASHRGRKKCVRTQAATAVFEAAKLREPEPLNAETLARREAVVPDLSGVKRVVSTPVFVPRAAAAAAAPSAVPSVPEAPPSVRQRSAAIMKNSSACRGHARA